MVISMLQELYLDVQRMILCPLVIVSLHSHFVVSHLVGCYEFRLWGRHGDGWVGRGMWHQASWI